MKAVRLGLRGEPLQDVAVPLPEIGPGDVLLRVVGSAIRTRIVASATNQQAEAMNVVVRRITVTPADIARYRACRLEMLADEPIAFTDTYDHAIARPQSFWTERVNRGAEGNKQLLLVVETGEAFVGSFTATINDDHVCWITGVWVDKQHRGTGLAAAFLERTRQWAHEAGATRLMLHVNATNNRARRFYEREGFALTGEKHPHESFPDTDELELSCPIDR
jgi:GNAT superfamily N-acetyltransferase